MTPAILAGSLVFIQQRKWYQPGEVISFKPSGDKSVFSLITHRIVGSVSQPSGRVYFTKGDANQDVDLLTVPEKNIVGQVWLVIPGLGWLVKLAQSVAGWGLAMGLLGLLIGKYVWPII